ncbi:hypothetical protein BDEG_25180 [Batrachochytrium dendrobatidis JEL423]|uniref:Stabilizer of axonemal microtubules 2 n=1 Tax=Batrachochytrium dendrobatidis (strain JEL423) TaxID=403673 RepID=A0A177WNA9_BATDL|nr:hypothetical protein O5D80_002729 [Batrachochytrium dendrobatidis]OAJ41608.1 hypothetical protein BDEG_25180 [Batrachochytrium dendrobatidis JEL423]
MNKAKVSSGKQTSAVLKKQSVSSKSCICSVCTCGHHKLCKPVTTNDSPFDAHTEYCDNFKKYPLDVRRGLPAPQELSVGGEFHSSTENREKYVLHTIPPRYKIKKETYSPNESSLESMTTQRRDYQAWPGVAPPKRRELQPWVSTSGSFDGSTTTKTDYVGFPLPPHYVRRQQPYVKSDVKFEGLSTQTNDFQKWPVTNIPTRRKAAPSPVVSQEDRDFQSTTASSYIEHQIKRELVRAPQTRTTDSNNKFETISTTKEAFQVWNLPPRYQRHKAEYHPSSAGFDGQTTYKDTFSPKTAERYIHPTPTYVPNSAKFEGTSTNKSDYLPTGQILRCKDFRPRNVYVASADDRDFVSTTRGHHTPKPLHHCAATDWVKAGVVSNQDGHVRMVAQS